MRNDIVDLRDFYSSSLGERTRRVLRQKLAEMWPNLRGERIATLGYGTPLLRPWLTEAEQIIALMPAAQGVAYWPREGPNRSCLIDTNELPLPDATLDRVILMHALETSTDRDKMLSEVWRVTKSGGRILLVVPNRRGLWAHSDHTPFGHGEPFSGTQIRKLLRQHGFILNRLHRTLYTPPTNSRILLSLSNGFEKYGALLYPKFGGIILAEAGKQLYAPTLTKAAPAGNRLILPLPLTRPLYPTPTT